ncbi:MAG: methionyl-tRNA formyltransferase [Firmicutes bacterium]|nr:methionyl-tRNA formyltransferase [Bacillota bacterium]
MRIVFMGTPDIAATCLKRLLEEKMDVVGVYTQPDRPKNRGMKLAISPVKEVALAHGLPVLQPENFREDAAVEELRALRPDVVAVVAYGRILPQRVLEIAPRGFVNIHASILPRYRGSAPYQWAVLDGCAETGVSAMYLSREMDAGDVIAVSKTPIGENETAGELLDRLAVLGASLLADTMRAIESGTVRAAAQDASLASYAPMLDKRMSPIDWTKSAQQVHNHVRGLNPWPVATAEIAGIKLKIYETAVVPGKGEPGEILELRKTGLVVACGEGAVELRSVQADGGRRMTAADYFRGHPIRAHE